MNKLIDKKLYDLMMKFFPQEYAYLNITENIGRLNIVQHKAKVRALYELRVHKESIDKNNIMAIGFDDLVNTLRNIPDETICIIYGHSQEYGFEIHLNNELLKRLGFLLIKRRKKTKEEILWEKKLGITHDD